MLRNKTTLPSGSLWYNQAMRLFNYDEKVYSNGICAGYFYQATYAFLADDFFTTFNDRLLLIANEPNIVKQIASLTTLRTRLIHLIKNKYHKDFEALDKEKFVELPEVREKIIALVQHNPSLREENQKQTFEKRKNDLLYNAFLQNKIDEIFSTLPKNTLLAFDVPIFFDGIMLSQDPSKYPQFFNSKKRLTQINHSGISLLLSKKLEPFGCIAAEETFSNIYDKATLITYLDSFKAAAQSINLPPDEPIILGLSSHHHQIGLGFVNNQWTMIDSVNIQLGRCLTTDHHELSDKIIKSFYRKPVFATRIFGKKTSEETLNKLVRCWKEQEDWKKIHCFSAQSVSKNKADAVLWLHISSMFNQLENVEFLLLSQVDPNQVVEHHTPLITAIDEENLDIALTLLAAGANPQVTIQGGLTPLYMASQCGLLDFVYALLVSGADPNQVASNQHTPIFVASYEGYLDIALALLANGADPNYANKNNNITSLHLASEKGHVGIVQALLAKGADPNQATTDRGATPLQLASQGGHLDIVLALLAAGADPNQMIKDDAFTPLQLAVENGYLDIALALLAYDANPNQIATKDKVTPLYIALQNRQLDMVVALLTYGADFDKANLNQEKTKIDHRFFSQPNTPPLKEMSLPELIEKYKLPDESSTSLELGLRKAAFGNHAADLRIFADKIKNINAQDSNVKTRYTAFHLAAKKGNVECIDLLLQLGADQNIKDADGLEPIDHVKNAMSAVLK